MQICLTTTDSITLELAGAIATDQPEFIANYIDTSSDVPGSTKDELNSTTPVTAVAAPASGQRLVYRIDVANLDTNAVIVVVRIAGGTSRTVIRRQIAAGGSVNLLDYSSGGSILSGMTQNYLQKATSSSEIGDSRIVDTGTQVTFPVTPYSVDVTADVMITATGATKTPLVLQAAAGVSTNLFEGQFSTGALAFRVDNAGSLWTANDHGYYGEYGACMIDSAIIRWSDSHNVTTGDLVLGRHEATCLYLSDGGTGKFLAIREASVPTAYSETDTSGHDVYFRAEDGNGSGLNGGSFVFVPGALVGAGTAGKVDIQRDGIATTSTDALLLSNNTLATAGTTSQYSPRIRFRGSAWDTDTGIADTWDWNTYVVMVSGLDTSSRIQWNYSKNGAAENAAGYLTSGGLLWIAGALNTTTNVYAGSYVSATTYVQAAAGSGFFLGSSAGMTSPSSGVISINNGTVTSTALRLSAAGRVYGYAVSTPTAHGTASNHTSNGTLITLTTTSAHSLVAGQVITLAGWTWSDGGGDINKTVLVNTTPTSTTITVAPASFGGTCPTSGTNPSVVGTITPNAVLQLGGTPTGAAYDTDVLIQQSSTTKIPLRVNALSSVTDLAYFSGNSGTFRLTSACGIVNNGNNIMAGSLGVGSGLWLDTNFWDVGLHRAAVPT